MRIHLPLIFLLLCWVQVPGFGQDPSRYQVPPKVAFKATPFELQDVRLLEGSPLKQAMDRNADYVLQLEADRLLHRWRKNAGLTPKAPLYGGWEDRSSHMLGHYLTACVLQYAASGDKRFLDRANYVVDELAECQKARKTGYVGGIPDEDKIWREVVAGNIRSGGFDLNGGWVPWYMLHKVWDGLLDAYLYTGNEKAKQVVVKLSDWAYATFKDLPEEKFQQMLEAEFGGMNESLAEVYAITGDRKYLDLAYRFDHKKVIDPLARRENKLAGLHANTQIPKVLGNARLYELTGQERDHTVAGFFYEEVVNHHSYVNGGHSNYEYFSPRGKLTNTLGTNTAETCNTYNMLKLARHLFTWDPQARYADYYERALYNHILASQHPETGMFCYYVALKSGKQKVFSTPFESFWCCVGTGIENHAKYGEAIYFKGADGGLYVNLFIPSELQWKERGLKVRQQTDYPQADRTTITFQSGKAARFPLHIRYPQWAEQGLEVRVNGKAVAVEGTPGSFVSLNRKWKRGDVVEVRMPMTLRTEAMPDNPGQVGVLYGPVLLAGALGKGELSSLDIPVLITENQPVETWVKPRDTQALAFRTEGVGRPKDIPLVPFYQLYDQKHVVYWDLFTPQEWTEKKAAFEAELARQAEIEQRTVDVVRLGEMQPEKDHNLQGENTGVGEYDNRKFRDAPNGGWFSFEMKVAPDQALALLNTYYGGDRGNRKFDILIDGVKLVTEELRGEKPREFVDTVYPIPEKMTKGKTSITVTFKGHPGNIAGGLYVSRLVRQPAKTL